MAIKFANCMESIKGSTVRELLKITQRPGIISFAGGLPAAELFPIEEMKKVAVAVLEESGKKALQYSTTEGFEPLRKQIALRMNTNLKTNVDYSNILITCGSQQALDFSGKLFLNPGDVILCESPTYLAAISAFKAYCPRFIEVPTDDHGMITEKLEKILQTTENVKIIYIIPDFQNPTGRTWSLERRQQFAEVINKYEIPVIEDNPYGELRFEGEALPPVKYFDKKGLVVFLGTFSKTFCPGLRIGWITAGSLFFEKYVHIKQGSDLHTSSISQREISKYIELYDFDAHIKKIINVYRNRRDVMIKAMQEGFSPSMKFNSPKGGLFSWVQMPEHMNASELLKQCLNYDVAFVPGDSFFPNEKVQNTFRLNFSNMPEERIIEGIQRISKVMKNI